MRAYTQYHETQYILNNGKRVKSSSFPIERAEDKTKKSIELFETEKKIANGLAVHLFLPDKAFCDWLCGAVEISDVEFGKNAFRFFHHIGNRLAVVHFPCQSGVPSFVAEIGGGSDEPLKITLSREARGPSGYLEFGKIPGEEVHKLQLFTANIISGIGLYLSCFPEQIKDGIPEDAKHPQYFKNQVSRSITISPKVISHNGPTPHYRVGHFVLLASDKFKFKKGSVIFRKGCFVKGQAKTVLGAGKGAQQ
jgi:hypothetical protein